MGEKERGGGEFVYGNDFKSNAAAAASVSRRPQSRRPTAPTAGLFLSQLFLEDATATATANGKR